MLSRDFKNGKGDKTLKTEYWIALALVYGFMTLLHAHAHRKAECTDFVNLFGALLAMFILAGIAIGLAELVMWGAG